MSRPTVLLTDNDLGDRRLEIDLLESALDANVITADCSTEDDVLQQVLATRPDAIITQWAPITRRVLEAAVGCRIVSRVGIGIDMIDVDAAAELGIDVRNVPHYCTEEVATHAVAMAMALWRRLPQFDAELRRGTWNAAAHASSISRLSDATIGIVGGGRIGMLVARAFEVWGSRIIVVDPVVGDDGYPRVSKEELAATADVISLHAPLVPQTRHFIDADFLARAERRPIIVNTSRGGLIDIDAVVAALHEGALRGVGLDVFDPEPLALEHPIRQAPNALLAPHAAWCSDAALPELRRGAVMNVVDALQGIDLERVPA